MTDYYFVYFLNKSFFQCSYHLHPNRLNINIDLSHFGLDYSDNPTNLSVSDVFFCISFLLTCNKLPIFWNFKQYYYYLSFWRSEVQVQAGWIINSQGWSQDIDWITFLSGAQSSLPRSWDCLQNSISYSGRTEVSASYWPSTGGCSWCQGHLLFLSQSPLQKHKSCSLLGQ